MKQHLSQLLQQAITKLQQQQQLPAELQFEIHIEQTKNPAHGELASNIALILSKQARQAPRELAEKICSALPSSTQLLKTQIAGPGFINFFLNADSQQRIISTILEQQGDFGRNRYGQGQSVQVEFVSANPTGPLHVGHGRGAAYGACVANLLNACGYTVQREYYINDAGRQMDILATSIWLRYLQVCGQTFSFPSNGYKGDYIIRYAQQLFELQHTALVFANEKVFSNISADETHGGDKEKHIDDLIAKTKMLLQENYTLVFNLGLDAILTDIRQDLRVFGVHFDTWFSERSLNCYGTQQQNLISSIIEKLKAKNCTEERDGALWFLSQQLGDDKDRVLQRSNGQTTYFASDIAYHYEKFMRGFDKVINVWGSDHHGYIARIKAALSALDIDTDKLEIKLVQFVSLYRGTQQISMSTRSGEFVTLQELVAEVGSDAARFFYIMHKVEQATDFDLQLAKSQSQDNPVYYVQYAHARICSMLRKLEEATIIYEQQTALAHLSLLDQQQEKQLMKTLSAYPDIVLKAATSSEPHLVVNFLRTLASEYHSYYNTHKVIGSNLLLTQARCALSLAVKQTLANGLTLLDISQPEKM